MTCLLRGGFERLRRHTARRRARPPPPPPFSPPPVSLRWRHGTDRGARSRGGRARLRALAAAAAARARARAAAGGGWRQRPVYDPDSLLGARGARQARHRRAAGAAASASAQRPSPSRSAAIAQAPKELVAEVRDAARGRRAILERRATSPWRWVTTPSCSPPCRSCSRMSMEVGASCAERTHCLDPPVPSSTASRTPAWRRRCGCGRGQRRACRRVMLGEFGATSENVAPNVEQCAGERTSPRAPAAGRRG